MKGDKARGGKGKNRKGFKGPTKEDLRKQKDEIEATIPMHVEKCRHIAGCRRSDKKLQRRRRHKNEGRELRSSEHRGVLPNTAERCANLVGFILSVCIFVWSFIFHKHITSKLSGK